MIKAIETSYKNFRFRSRNEARWAVCFDSLGIKWEYEAEGFDLGEHGYYLPDFWLPESRQFVEIKPESKDKKQLKFYFAGKISSYKNDWRYPLVNSNLSFGSFSEYKKSLCLHTYPYGCINGHQYVGPFAIDNNSGHGVGGHCDDGLFSSDHGYEFDVDHEVGGFILSTCKKQIAKADIMFVWIDSPDCYGTLAEIGFAHAMGKRIWIGISSALNFLDFWFVGEMAQRWSSFNTALDAFSCFNDSLNEHEKKCMALSEKSDVVLLEGSPGSDSNHADYYQRKVVDCFAGNLDVTSNNRLSVLHDGWHNTKGKSRLEKAYAAARSARFEHGDRPR